MFSDNPGSSYNLGLFSYDVVIPCFNRAETVERAVASVLSQVPSPERVIVIDDGSSDDTAQIIAVLARRYSSVHAVFLPRNMGASAARNSGLARARAEWVAFLDSDDAWVPGAAHALLAAASDSDVIVGQFRRAWASGILDAPECGWDGEDILSALALTGAVGPSWSLIRRATALRAGGFDPAYHNCNDWDFYVRIAAGGARFTRIDATIAHYHVAAANRLSLDQAIGQANASRVRARAMLLQRSAKTPVPAATIAQVASDLPLG